MKLSNLFRPDKVVLVEDSQSVMVQVTLKDGTRAWLSVDDDSRFGFFAALKFSKDSSVLNNEDVTGWTDNVIPLGANPRSKMKEIVVSVTEKLKEIVSELDAKQAKEQFEDIVQKVSNAHFIVAKHMMDKKDSSWKVKAQRELIENDLEDYADV